MRRHPPELSFRRKGELFWNSRVGPGKRSGYRTSLPARRINKLHRTSRTDTECYKCNADLRLTAGHERLVALSRARWWAQVEAELFQARSPALAILTVSAKFIP